MSDDETLTMRPTVIGVQRCADDYQVIWRGMSIGRIMGASGVPTDKQQWSWNCHLDGSPCRGGESRTGDSLDACPGGMGGHPRRAHRCGHRQGAAIRRRQRRGARPIWKGEVIA